MSPPPDLRGRGPSPLFLGIDHLLRIRRDQLAFYAEMQARHGDAVPVRLGPYRLWLLFHPDLVEQVLARRAQSFIRFRRMMAVLRQWNGDSLLLAEGESWRDRRRKVLPAFRTRRLPGYAAAVVEETEALCGRLAAQAEGSGVAAFDADAAMARLSLDIAARTLFGADPEAAGGGVGEGVEKAVQALSRIAFSESAAPFSAPDWLPLPVKREKREAIRNLDSYVRDLVAKALARAGEDRDDLISSLIAHHEGRAEEIRDDAMSLLIAGHETSGAALAWALACLAANPEPLARTQTQIRTVLGARPLRVEDLEAMPLLRAAIDETLRLHPPAYTLFLREAVEEVALEGARIRPGDLVQILPWVTQRDPRFFPDPERFDPDRFLRPPTWPDYAYIPFGAGPRVCIGRSFGLMEAALALATLLRRFDLEPLAAAPRPAARFSLRPEGGLPMRWRPA